MKGMRGAPSAGTVNDTGQYKTIKAWVFLTLLAVLAEIIMCQRNGSVRRWNAHRTL